MIDDRKAYILKKIIENFIACAEPIGSKTLLESSKMSISAATIRNEMAFLESIGLIYQPHTSSGRVPTMKGFRVFVDRLMDQIPEQVIEKEIAEQTIEKWKVNELDMRIRNAVSLVSRATQLVAFATLPWRNDSYYLGIANVLKKEEFQNSVAASTIIEVLEDKDNFIRTLSHLNISREVKAFIGEENAIEGIKSCTMLVTMFERGKFRGAIGILGPTRMRYAYNMKILEKIREELEV